SRWSPGCFAERLRSPVARSSAPKVDVRLELRRSDPHQHHLQPHIAVRPEPGDLPLFSVAQQHLILCAFEAAGNSEVQADVITRRPRGRVQFQRESQRVVSARIFEVELERLAFDADELRSRHDLGAVPDLEREEELLAGRSLRETAKTQTDGAEDREVATCHFRVLNAGRPWILTFLEAS